MKRPMAVMMVGAAVLSSCTSAVTFNQGDSTYQGTELTGEAADFSLVDQINTSVSLSDFRGKVVVLTFMDSQCKEVCPATAAHLRKASQDLGESERQATFLAVNVNTEANSVEDVAAATKGWKLTEIPDWHFLTGSPEELNLVWVAYGIAVVLPAGEEGLIHTPGVFIIDQSGNKRWYISTALDDPGSSQWIPPLSELLVWHIGELIEENVKGTQ